MSHVYWKADLLGRQQQAQLLIEFLRRRHAERKKAEIKGAYVLNVNAEWGFGKTYFARGLAAEMAAQHPVVMIDAWKNDFAEDPYAMVMSEIDAVLSPLVRSDQSAEGATARKLLRGVRRNTGKIILAGAKGASKKVLTKLFGDGAETISELVFNERSSDESSNNGTEDGDELLKECMGAAIAGLGDGIADVSAELLDSLAKRMINDYQEVKLSQEQFRYSLGQLLRSIEKVSPLKLPLFVIIDELDRCRPPYAISLLERIKHLFDVDDIVFVVSTDTRQLTSAINGFYGADFDGHRYLQRFFTRTFTLPKPSPREFIASLIAASGVDTKRWKTAGDEQNETDFLAKVSECFLCDLREIERAMDILFDLTTSWTHGFPIELVLMYPYILGYLRSKDVSSWDKSPVNQEMISSAKGLVLGSPVYDRRSETYGSPPTLQDYISEIRTNSGRNIYDILNADRDFDRSPPPERRHLLDSLLVEFKSQENGGGRDMKSVMDRYPEMIRFTARLGN